MTVFVDTSALFAILDNDDPNHVRALQRWDDLLAGERPLRTHSYVLAEIAALTQIRLGLQAARDLHTAYARALSIRFVDASLHQRAVTALLAANRRSISFVDWTSFEQMRDEVLDEAFAFDGDFEAQGFTVSP